MTGKPLIIIGLDAQKAFDSVAHLAIKGVNGVVRINRTQKGIW